MFQPRLSLPDSAPETKSIAPVEVPKLQTVGHEQPPRSIALNFVPEDTYTGNETAAGLLLLDLRLGARRFISVICICEQGFPAGSEIQENLRRGDTRDGRIVEVTIRSGLEKIPEIWRKFCREEEAGNVCDSSVVKAIGVGEEIVLRPADRKGDSQEASGFSCDRCGKVFSYSYYRDKHLKYTRCVDNGDRKFPCPICSRSFEKRDRLRIHVLHVHENHRPHCCAICGKAFSQSSSLNKHLRVHSGERPYSCPYCPKAFTASSILRTHIRQHSGEKPFKCAHCGKAFASHAAHDSHVRRTHLKTA